MEAATGSSAINAVHPDDDPEQFFGGDGEDEASPDSSPGEDKPVEASTEQEEAEAPRDGEVKPPHDPEPAPEPAQRGDAEREYIVFQEAPLTEKTLKHLLAQIESGEAPQPRIAFFELERTKARNPNGAVVKAYNEHKSVLGDKADLAVVSAKSLARRHVEPKQRVETALSIS